MTNNILYLLTAIVCDELEALENGMIVYAPDSTGPEYDLNTVATYLCDEGFELVGDETRTCEDAGAGVSGEFSGTAATCGCKYSSLFQALFLWFFCMQPLELLS